MAVAKFTVVLNLANHIEIRLLDEYCANRAPASGEVHSQVRLAPASQTQFPRGVLCTLPQAFRVCPIWYSKTSVRVEYCSCPARLQTVPEFVVIHLPKRRHVLLLRRVSAQMSDIYQGRLPALAERLNSFPGA